MDALVTFLIIFKVGTHSKGMLIQRGCQFKDCRLILGKVNHRASKQVIRLLLEMCKMEECRICCLPDSVNLAIGDNMKNTQEQSKTVTRIQCREIEF